MANDNISSPLNHISGSRDVIAITSDQVVMAI